MMMLVWNGVSCGRRKKKYTGRMEVLFIEKFPPWPGNKSSYIVTLPFKVQHTRNTDQ